MITILLVIFYYDVEASALSNGQSMVCSVLAREFSSVPYKASAVTDKVREFTTR